MHPTFTEINMSQRWAVIHISSLSSFECTVYTLSCSLTYTHTYITLKKELMNSGDLKMYKYIKILKSNFFMNTRLFLHSICSENKKQAESENDILLWIFLYPNKCFHFIMAKGKLYLICFQCKYTNPFSEKFRTVDIGSNAIIVKTWGKLKVKIFGYLFDT